MEIEKNPLPPDELRCKRSDGRGWRCKLPAIPGKTLCDNHLNRSSAQKKNPKNKDNYKSALDVSTPKSTPKLRILLRVKPEPEDDNEPDVGPSAILALPAGSARFSHERARVEKKGPRVKRPAVIAEMEGRDNCDVSNVELDMRENGDDNHAVVEGMNAAVAEKRGPRVKRPSVIDNMADSVNGDCNVVVRTVLGMKGPRTKRPSVIDGVEENENAIRKDPNVGVRTELGMRGPRMKRPNFIGHEVAIGDVQCKRDSGRGWRCQRVAREGYTMCDVHLSKAKECREKAAEKSEGKVKGKEVESETDEREKKKKMKMTSDSIAMSGCEVVVKKEVESEKEEEEEEEEGNRLAMVADLAVAEAEAEAEAEAKERGGREEEDWRCKRTDGRRWRCKRRVLEGKTLCEIHHEQGRLRGKKITVPESLKIQKREGGVRTEKKLKRKRGLENNLDKGKRMKGDSIRVFLKREIIEKNKKSETGVGKKSSSGEVTKDLPYGLMEIPPAPSSHVLENGRSLEIKDGVHSPDSLVKKRFRSKNVKPPAAGESKVGNMGKAKNSGRRKCHWCQNSEKSSLTKCLTCKKQFFCANCVKERLYDMTCPGTIGKSSLTKCLSCRTQFFCASGMKMRDHDAEEVKVKCPVCRGNCDCKACCMTQTNAVTTKEILKVASQGSKLQQLEYLIKLLLPILEQINQEQGVETETEARFKGLDLSEVEIRQAEVGCRDQLCCNNCKTPILDFHRSCPNCSYNLCLNCCREYSQGGSLIGTESSWSKLDNILKTRLPGLRICSEKTSMSSSVHISCPSMELGGCDNSLLDLRCIFPLNFTKELEISAKETGFAHEFPLTTDNSLHCSFCASITAASDKNKEIQEASRRIQSRDNFIYCPNSSDDRHYVLAHFQQHWHKGQPVKVQNALQLSSPLNWDPVAIFCRCLEDNPSNCVNIKDATEAESCKDSYEIEIGSMESFAQSPVEGCTHRRHKTLRVNAKLSSTLTQRLLEDHYIEIIDGLPLQEYTNPRSGLLNIAGKLPEGFPESKLGPHVCVSFGSRDVVTRGELVTKLHHNSYDVVNVLAHVADVTCSTEQLNKISMLIKPNSIKNNEDQSSGEVGGQDGSPEGTATNDVSAVNLPDDKSPAKLQSSDTDSDASVICSGTNDCINKSIDQMSLLEFPQSSRLSDNRPIGVCGSYWDVFRRQDVPKLLEYINKHLEELSFSCDISKNVHPIFDGNFYLDSTHKMQLKEEFDIEPWTFKQCYGEAVFIPAGCPYQTRNVKSCVSIELGFISPENAPRCLKLINEIRALPNNHKAKEVKLEVEKMTICSIDDAIRDIYRLRIEESSLLDKGIQIASPNS